MAATNALLAATWLLGLCSAIYDDEIGAFGNSSSTAPVQASQNGGCQLNLKKEFKPDADIVFGQSAALSGPNDFLGTALREGIIAALTEANSRVSLSGAGPTFGLVSYDDGYLPECAQPNTEMLTEDPRIFALLGYVGTPTASVSAPIAAERHFPFIGAFTGASLLRQRGEDFVRYYVNYRASYIDETAAMVGYFVDDLKLTKISVFLQGEPGTGVPPTPDGFGKAGLEGVVLALGARGLEVCSQGTYPRNTEDPQNDIQPGLDAMVENADCGAPEAIIMIGTADPLAAFVVAARKVTSPAGWDQALFATVSFVGSEKFAVLLGSPQNREGVFVTQVVPFTLDTTLPIVRDYQAALQACTVCTKTSFTSLEGYIVGRFAATVATSVLQAGSLSREHFLDAIYDNGIVFLGSYLLGPFGGNCHCKNSCKCNQGQRQVFGTTIEPQGSLTPFSPLDLRFATCGIQYDTTSEY